MSDKFDIKQFDGWTAKAIRNATIEECARVAEDQLYGHARCSIVAAAIRGLKDKP